MATFPSQCRLFAILAREAPVGVIFRRGPSKEVLLIKWNLLRDTFETGQWFKGRIYERRCDLSPSGRKLIYLAAKWKKPIESWTAISCPPYLTALALWENQGAWGGGGLFETERRIRLNHKPSYDKLEKGFSVPKDVRIIPHGEYSGHGEDYPIYFDRLARDGWTLKDRGDDPQPNWDADIVWNYKRPIIYEKENGSRRLQMMIKGVSKRNDAWYVVDHGVANEDGEVVLLLPHTEWADWDQNGDLLYSQSGMLFRCRHVRRRNREPLLEPPTMLADFSKLTFEQKAALRPALKW